MITWIQTYFQKHFRTIFAVLLGVTIISFIFGINASGGFGRADRQSSNRPFFGHNLNSEQEIGRLMRDGSNSAKLKGGSQLDESMVQQYSLSRVAGLALADELHLPIPSEKEVATYISTLRIFQDQQGRFDQKRYGDFADSLKSQTMLSVADANRIFRDDTRLEALNHLIGGPGYVLPPDVHELLNRTDTKWSVAIATLDYTKFDPSITVTEESLKKFFDEKSDSYRVSPRSKLSSVEFKSEEFIPSGPLPEDQLRAFYNSNLARFPVPAEPATAAPAAGMDNFSKVRLQVELAFRVELAKRAAVKAANDFTVALYEGKAGANSPELATFLSSQNRTAVALEPFSADNPPATMPWLTDYRALEQASRLDKDHFFSDPLPTATGATVLLWNDTLPAYQPNFAEVREKISADYKENEKRKRFIAQGQMLQTKLSAAIKAGTSFDTAAAEAKLEVKSFANFTLQDTPKDMPGAAHQALQTLKAGEISEMIDTGDKGYLVFAAQKQLPDMAPTSPRFTEMRTRLMAYYSATTGNAILGNLVKAELDKTAPPSTAATATK